MPTAAHPHGQPQRPTADPGPDVRVDVGFAALIPPLSPGERAELERSLLAEGCRDALLAWDGVLIDGHNRLAICRAHGLPFRVEPIDFPDRDAAKGYVVAHQLGRRNLSPEATSYLRGRRYLAEKRPRGGDRSKAPANSQNGSSETAQRLADEYRIARNTVYRDAHFARVVDGIAENCGARARPAILAREGGLRRGTVLRLARRPAEEQRAAIEELLTTGRLPRPEAAGKRATITLPAAPRALAAKLLEKLGTRGCAKVVRALLPRLPGPAPKG
jgi:hypothetical protein